MSALDPFLDADLIALDDVAYALRRADEGFDDALGLEALVRLGTRLPSGLVHAEAIWLVPEPPPEVAPLAPHSPWYALDRALAVVLPPVRARLTGVLAELARYHAIAARVRRALGPHGALVEALGGPALGARMAAELAVLLDAPPSLAAGLDAASPGLRGDLAVMASQPFEPVVRLHAALRSGALRRRGRRLAEGLLTRLPEGPFRVLLSDAAGVLEHLSPYVRDLGHALTAWGLENEERLRVPELAAALRRAPARPSPDLAALVVPDVLAAAPELLEERRRAERSAGLAVVDEPGAVHAVAEVSRLALPDEQAVGGDASGTLVVLASEGEDLVLEALRAWLDTGRVQGVAALFGAPLEGPQPVVMDGLASEADGLRFTSAAELAERAAKLGVEVLRPGVLPVGPAPAAPQRVLDAFALVRRAQLLGRVPPEAAAFALLYPQGDEGRHRSLDEALSELQAGRLALGVLLSSREDPAVASRGRRILSQEGTIGSRRFRA